MSKTYWYFKLFNSIKEEHEIEFAEMELTSLFGKVERNANFAEILMDTPFKLFTKSARIQDYLAHELPYGSCQGFYAERENIPDLTLIVRRLAYIREFFVITPINGSECNLQNIFPPGEIDKNVQLFENGDLRLLRFITNQYFLEKSQYISKLSRNEKEVDKNVDALFAFLTKKLYRIPASATMQVGKRLEDYFTIREEPSLYLTHYMHPYKGRFHPKMVRALLNYVYPKNQGRVMDNFAGCGTLLVEATWMGLDNIGVEINPLSVLMSNIKCEALTIQPDELKKSIETYLRELEDALLSFEKQASGCALLIPPIYEITIIEEQKRGIPKKVLELFSKDAYTVERILIAKQLIENVKRKDIRDFLLLTLSGTISDLARRRNGRFIDVFRDRVNDLYLRVYTFSRLNKVLKIKLGVSQTFCGDTRDMREIADDESIDAIVNSPPYSTALDYIKNDFPQLAILGLSDMESLKINMIGNPNLSAYSEKAIEEITHENIEFSQLPVEAKDAILALKKCGRAKDAIRTFKFFNDMRLALSEMHRVLKKGAKCAIIIGNNNYKLDGNYAEVKNDEVLKQIALGIGFREDKSIRRELEKSRAGMIRYESILILEKNGS